VAPNSIVATRRGNSDTFVPALKGRAKLKPTLRVEDLFKASGSLSALFRIRPHYTAHPLEQFES